LANAPIAIQVGVGPIRQDMWQPGVEIQGEVGCHSVDRLADPVA